MSFPILTPLKPWDDFNFENTDYEVFVNGEKVFVYNVFVEMHDVHTAAFCTFDINSEKQVKITCKFPRYNVEIRPLSSNKEYEFKNGELTFTVSPSDKLSIEFDCDKFANLHLFANKSAPAPQGRQILPGVHRIENVVPQEGESIVFLPGLHYIEETLLPLPSHSHVHISEGACLIGSIVTDNVTDVKITGTGVINLREFPRYSAFRAIKITNSNHIEISGISVLNPPHYSIYMGQSQYVTIDNIKCFSHTGWSDGIDIMACENVDIKNIFMRNSDDCIAIYASRWQHVGSSSNISVSDTILWADVAHPMNVGIHALEGDKIENITFEHITVLDIHEPQEDYMGIMSVVAGDGAYVKNVAFKNITVERVTSGRLFDVRITQNKTYNKIPGKGIENISFENITAPKCTHPVRIEEKAVKNITFKNISSPDFKED